MSYYHHYKHIVGYQGSKNNFYEAFLNDLVVYGPYDEHVLDFYEMQNDDNVLFLTYENMKRDLYSVIINKKTIKFLNKQYDDDKVEKLVKHLGFDEMKGAIKNKLAEMDD